jgi:hypothetical protein
MHEACSDWAAYVAEGVPRLMPNSSLVSNKKKPLRMKGVLVPAVVCRWRAMSFDLPEAMQRAGAIGTSSFEMRRVFMKDAQGRDPCGGPEAHITLVARCHDFRRGRTHEKRCHWRHHGRQP